jgi:hypothetical protein
MAGVEVVFIVDESHYYALGKGGGRLSSMWNSMHHFVPI